MNFPVVYCHDIDIDYVIIAGARLRVLHTCSSHEKQAKTAAYNQNIDITNNIFFTKSKIGQFVIWWVC